MNSSCDSPISNLTMDPLGGHKVWEVVVIILITGPLSLVTIVGNLLVMISFRVNSHLRTVSNYFLLSLAVADLVLGTVSMNLYTTYIIMGRWVLGNLACDIWLAIDYVASNASVMNLLLISFDRFFSITRPLTYRAKRTPKRAAVMISLAWTISFVLWAPAILLWPYMVEEQVGEKVKCSILFLAEPVFTFGTAIAAFYLPVSIMIILYWRIYRETENRTRDLAGLLGLMDSNGGASLDSRRPVPYSISAKSSISSSRGMHAGESDDRGGGSGCLPIQLIRGRRSLTSSSHTDGQGNDGGWNIDEEEASDSSSSEARGMSVSVSHVPMIQLRDMQGEASWDQSLPRAQDRCPRTPRRPKAKKRRSMIVKEKKAAKTLSAILLAFIITWTPYNIMVLMSIFTCVPEKLWQLGYWLCYVNSTVNPVCYALCNKSFRVTFKMLLLLRWDKRKWGRPRRRPNLQPYISSSTI